MNILDLLNVDKFEGESEIIEIAKGKYQRVNTWRQAINKIKRQIQWLKR
jgi:hypothetical protein